MRVAPPASAAGGCAAGGAVVGGNSGTGGAVAGGAVAGGAVTGGSDVGAIRATFSDLTSTHAEIDATSSAKVPRAAK